MTTSRMRSPRRVAAPLLAALCVLAACGGGRPGSSTGGTLAGTPAPVVREPPEILSFDATPGTVQDGEEAILSWSVSDTDASLKLAPTQVVPTGTSITVSPIVTTTYTLSATNAAGTATRTVIVTVNVMSEIAPPDANLATADQWVNATANLEGMTSECGNLSSVASTTDPDRVIAGVALRGLWSLDPISEEWSPLGQDGGAVISNRMYSVVQDPQNADVFWESGSYSGGGVYRTSDGGASFQQLGDLTFVDGLSVDFTDPLRRTLVAGSHEQPTVYRSTDAGASWVRISDGLPDRIGYTSFPLVIDATTYLIGANSDDDSGIYRTTDAGSTWTLVSEFGVTGQPLRVPSDGMIYWLLEGRMGIVRSADDGETWTVTSESPSAETSVSLQVLSDGRIVAIGDGSLIVSSDQGETWSRFGPALPYEPNGFAYSNSLEAFFAWRFDCTFGTDNLVPADAIIRLDISP